MASAAAGALAAPDPPAIVARHPRGERQRAVIGGSLMFATLLLGDGTSSEAGPGRVAACA